MLDWGEYLSLDADNLPSAVYLTCVETPPKSNDGYFMFLQFGVGQAHIFGGACSKCKCPHVFFLVFFFSLFNFFNPCLE